MHRDSKAFRERFQRWKAGETVYDAGRLIEQPDAIRTDQQNRQQLRQSVAGANEALRQAMMQRATTNTTQVSADTRTATERRQLQQQAAVDRERYRRQQQKEKAQEGFDQLMSLTMPSTYIGQAIGQPITGAAALATDALAFSAAGALKSGVKAAAKSYARRGFNTLNTPRGLLSDEPLIARGNPNIPYQIERYPGFMLKPLMEGNSLEKQLSKTGTISVNSIRAHAAKASEMERSVINKILSSDAFTGQKAVDYNKFRKAVQDELINYSTKPQTKYSTYGMDRLGFNVIKEPDGVGGIIEYSPGVRTNTFTFESPKIPLGSDKHYDSTSLGHSRTYTTPNEPDVLHVMESQSDWAQEGRIRHDLKRVNLANERLEKVNESLDKWRNALNTGIAPNGTPLEPWARRQIKDEFIPNALAQQWKYDGILKTAQVEEQALHLSDNYTSRQIQENLKYAAEHGQTKMRYPTPETAAKIEEYAKNYKSSPRYEQLLERQQKLRNLPEFKVPSPDPEMFLDMTPDEFAQFEADYIRLIESPRYQKAKRIYDRLDDEMYEELRKIQPDYSPQHKTILKKYSEFPKQFKKLWKDQEVRTATDQKGNSWYEVDVPKNFLKREWIYSIAPWVVGGGLTIPALNK